MRHFLSLVASYRNSGRIGDQAKALVLMKVLSKGDDRIIVQLYTKQIFTFHRKRFHQEYQKLLTGS